MWPGMVFSYVGLIFAAICFLHFYLKPHAYPKRKNMMDVKMNKHIEDTAVSVIVDALSTVATY